MLGREDKRALNSSVEEQLPAKSVVKGCKDPF